VAFSTSYFAQKPVDVGRRAARSMNDLRSEAMLILQYQPVMDLYFDMRDASIYLPQHAESEKGRSLCVTIEHLVLSTPTPAPLQTAPTARPASATETVRFVSGFVCSFAFLLF
jgi:hypothetical protein